MDYYENAMKWHESAKFSLTGGFYQQSVSQSCLAAELFLKSVLAVTDPKSQLDRSHDTIGIYNAVSRRYPTGRDLLPGIRLLRKYFNEARYPFGDGGAFTGELAREFIEYVTNVKDYVDSECGRERKMNQVKAPDTRKLSKDDFREDNPPSLCWLGGGGFMLNINGAVIFIDPVLCVKSPRVCETGLPMLVDYPIDAKDIPRADAVLYTHTDSDHLAPVTAGILIEKSPLFLGTQKVIDKLIAMGADEFQCVPGVPGDTFKFNGITVEWTPADHAYPSSGFGAEDCCGYLIKTDSGTCWFTGDTRLMREHFNINGVDIFALDASRDAYHLGTESAAALANHLKEAVLIPYHYGTYDKPEHTAFNGNPRDVLALVDNAGERTRILAPGEMIKIRRYGDTNE